MERAKLKAERVCYIGNDHSFLQNISSRFDSTYPQKDWDFSHISPQKNDRYESLFLKILELMPKIIYVDFSEGIDRAMSLAELLGRDPLFKQVPLIGFVDKKEDARKCLGAGVDFIYVKGGEFYDIIHSAVTMAYSKMAKKPQFAKAELSQEIDLFDDFRVGYIAPTYIHVEGNFDLKEGSIVHFSNEIPLANVPSKKFIVKNRTCHNLYYDYNFAYDLDFVFVDEKKEEEKVEVAEEESAPSDAGERQKAKIAALKAEKEKVREERELFEKSVKMSMKKHKEWVVDRMTDTIEKKTKLLIIDRSMRVFDSIEGKDALSSLPFSVRCQTSFTQDLGEIDRQRPAIIAYQFMGELGLDDDDIFEEAVNRNKAYALEKAVEELEDADLEKRVEELAAELSEKEKSEMSFVKYIVEQVKAIDNYNPILVFFRCYYKSSKALQESFQYPMIVVHQDNLNLDVCLDLASIYEAKQKDKFNKLIKAKVKQLKTKDPAKYRNLTEEDFRENKCFIRKSNTLSFGGLKVKVVLKTLSESEVIFCSDIELPMKTYRLEFPMAMSIHLVPIEEGKNYLSEKGNFIYKGLIHSISEVDKRTLRQQVNEVIFSPLNEKREKEQADFKELNEKVYQDLSERKKNIEEAQEERAKEELGLGDD